MFENAASYFYMLQSAWCFFDIAYCSMALVIMPRGGGGRNLAPRVTSSKRSEFDRCPACRHSPSSAHQKSIYRGATRSEKPFSTLPSPSHHPALGRPPHTPNPLPSLDHSHQPCHHRAYLVFCSLASHGAEWIELSRWGEVVGRMGFWVVGWAGVHCRYT